MSRYGDEEEIIRSFVKDEKRGDSRREFPLFRFLYSLTSSIIQQEIGYMTMPDTLHIILPQAVHANYIFRIMVVMASKGANSLSTVACEAN